jgi:predicted histidine transporter YuiF (NhaC family)
MLVTNPVVVSVLVMIVLCLFNLNIILAVLVAAVSAGLMAGMSLTDTMATLISGMGGSSETALSYFLLGAFAVAISKTGLAAVACKTIAAAIKGRRIMLMFILAFIAILSQNAVPIHIAFIPILIPPLLGLFNKMKVDRRQVACALAFGLKAPYIATPVGFGLIFYGIIAKEMTSNGISVESSSIVYYNWILGLSMVVGLLLALFAYNKPRDYKDIPVGNIETQDAADDHFQKSHLLTLIAVVVAFGLQLYTGSLPIGIFTGLMIMILTGALKWKDIDSAFNGGLGIMGLIIFVILISAGYGTVLRETKSVEHLVTAVVGMVGGSKAWGACLMLVVGLLVTMGIGTSFGTIPIVAAIYCPLALELGFSTGATAALIATAAALGDAGSPASDTTLGPTAGLNADGQHNHIWDTCVPTFIFYNIPLFIAGMISAFVF